MPSLTQLEYIVAVDKLRHFGKAADACHVTQPTLSMQIQKVEEEIGFPLFDRLKKPVTPTLKGQRFIHQAKILLHEHFKLMDLSKSQGDEVSGELRLGVIPTVAPYLTPLFLAAFSKAYPKVTLTIDELKTEEIIRALRDDEIDAGILATPLNEKGLTEKPLYYEPFYLYTAKGSPLAERKRIKEDDLRANDMWLLSDGHCFRSQIVRYCSIKDSEGIYPNVTFAGGNLDTLRNMIRNTRGYTLVPALFVEYLSETERKAHVRPFERPAPTREISLIYRRDQWKSDILKALESTVRGHLPKSVSKEHDSKVQDVIPIES